MSRLTDLLRQLRSADPQLGADLEKEIAALTKRRSFGLVFERHQPEAVELPGQPVRRGAKVRVLPPRGQIAKGDPRLWRVESFVSDESGAQLGQLVENATDEPERRTASLDDLVVVAEFDDKIFPGLVETGRIERGGDKPFHTVINAENYHALEMLTYTHRGKVDAIYIDPPYNTGARDWKYNNDYVEGDDDYRHSKWLAFMERRLLVARELLNPSDSVLIVTIDEKEYLRLGMLLQQTFPEARIQMVSIVINGQGSARKMAMSRVDEYAYFVYIGDSAPIEAPIETLPSDDNQSQVGTERIWFPLIRGGKSGTREKSNDSFFPVYVDRESGKIMGSGVPLARDQHPEDAPAPPSGCDAIWPISKEGAEGRWQMSRPEFMDRLGNGYIRSGKKDKSGRWPITYIRSGTIDRIREGGVVVQGRDERGALILSNDPDNPRGRTPKTVWYLKSHNSGTYGTDLLGQFLKKREFPFPKSLYAVEDALRFFVKDKPYATIVDFFSGSGTTAHAVMRLNHQDGGSRQCISVTNNEVGADEQKRLCQQGLRPGDLAWEQWGICDYITKPRIRAAITGRTPDGEPVKGDYKFTDEFPMADGFAENAAFFTLTYESPLSVRHNRAFERIAPMLWMRAGSTGRIIDNLSGRGWDVSEVYAVLENIDNAEDFFTAMHDAESVRTVFVVTDDDAAFQMVCRELPSELDMVRLYESYLQNFEINQGRSI